MGNGDVTRKRSGADYSERDSVVIDKSRYAMQAFNYQLNIDF